jgi:hypothetical protein
MCILHMRHGLIAGADADQRAAVAIQPERIVTVKLTRIVASVTPRSMASLTTGAPGDADPLLPEKVTASSLSSLASKSWPASATLAAVMTRGRFPLHWTSAGAACFPSRNADAIAQRARDGLGPDLFRDLGRHLDTVDEALNCSSFNPARGLDSKAPPAFPGSEGIAGPVLARASQSRSSGAFHRYRIFSPDRFRPADGPFIQHAAIRRSRQDSTRCASR